MPHSSSVASGVGITTSSSPESDSSHASNDEHTLAEIGLEEWVTYPQRDRLPDSPPGFVYIDFALAKIMDRLSCPPWKARSVLFAAGRAGELPAHWTSYDTKRDELTHKDWDSLKYDPDRRETEIREGLPHTCLWRGAEIIHPHAIMFPEDEVDYWLKSLPRQITNIAAAPRSETGSREPSERPQRIEPPGDRFSADVPRRLHATGQPCAYGALQSEPEAGTSLRNASAAKIGETIEEVYDYAAAQNMKPPNMNQIVEPVQRRLKRVGCTATGSYIQKIAGQPQHGGRRLTVGKKASKFRVFSDLEI